MERKRLEPHEVENGLAGLEGWKAEDGKLKKRLKFENFTESLAFVNKAGAVAEKADHHPDIKFGWGFAEFEITTHDSGGITAFDFDLAEKIDDLES
ncbi:MAG: 4a-hydroxytetrahydrobiopterin dehydratase [Saprospiraceae bacterium]|nr:4a-hydroxytetrahydrobiopterin dehydratase [Pyrinomonadaceae bacterium]